VFWLIALFGGLIDETFLQFFISEIDGCFLCIFSVIVIDVNDPKLVFILIGFRGFEELTWWKLIELVWDIWGVGD